MEDTGLIPIKSSPVVEREPSDETQFVGFRKGGVNSAESPKSTWLRTLDSPLPPNPSPELQHFISSCGKIISMDSITNRANLITDKIFDTFVVGHHGEWAQKRKHEALNLYYRVLQAMCKEEAQKSSLTSLLINERFHRCMLFCSSELILAAHNTGTMLVIAAVLERIGITGFDLCKVIESFVKMEKCLPRILRCHLNYFEEKLLEKIAWEKGSSLYNSLAVARPDLLEKMHRLSLIAERLPLLDSVGSRLGTPSRNSLAMSSAARGIESLPDPSIHTPKKMCTEYRSVLVDRNSFTTPTKHRMQQQQALKFAFASPSKVSRSVGEETCAKIGIDVFFGKILKLAALRIKGMGGKLKFPEKMIESIYSLFQIALKKGTSLFFNRHIDQIILCCFFMASKMAKRSLTFGDLISNYIKQPQYTHHVYSSVFVDHSQECYNGKAGVEHVSLSTFHNDIFVPIMKPLMMELSASILEENAVEVLIEHLGAPNMSPFPKIPDMSPKKVSLAHNVFVSTIRSSKLEAFISSSSDSCYAFVGESSREFQSPSKDLTVINGRLNGGRKVKGRLNFDDMDKPRLVNDSTVSESLFSEHKRFESSMDGIQGM